MNFVYHIIIVFLSIFICYKFGDWKNWRIYYPTILFFILCSIGCIVMTFNHPLWLYESKLMNHTFVDLFISITVYPCTIIVFICNFPNKPVKIFLHISFYVFIYTIVEFISFKLGYFSYYNGWNIWCSLIFNYIMFIILIIHHKNPIYGWIIALICPHILFFIMKIPYNTIR